MKTVYVPTFEVIEKLWLKQSFDKFVDTFYLSLTHEFSISCTSSIKLTEWRYKTESTRANWIVFYPENLDDIKAFIRMNSL